MTLQFEVMAEEQAEKREARGPSTFLAPTWKVLLALGIVIAVWGPNFLMIRVMVRTIPPAMGSGSRYAIAGLILLIFLAIRGVKLRLTRSELIGCSVLGLCICGANAIATWVLVKAPSGLTALIVASAPVMIILWRVFGRERVSRRSYIAVGLGLIGVVVLLLPGKQTGNAPILTLLTAFLAVLLFTGGSYWSPKLRLPENPFVTATWFMILGGLFSCLVGLVLGEGGEFIPWQFSLESVLGYSYVVIFASVVGFSTYTWLLKSAPISLVSTHAFAIPILAVTLGWVILGEHITWLTIIGSTVIVSAVILAVRAEMAPRRETEPVLIESPAGAATRE